MDAQIQGHAEKQSHLQRSEVCPKPAEHKCRLETDYHQDPNLGYGRHLLCMSLLDTSKKSFLSEPLLCACSAISSLRFCALA